MTKAIVASTNDIDKKPTKILPHGLVAGLVKSFLFLSFF